MNFWTRAEHKSDINAVCTTLRMRNIFHAINAAWATKINFQFCFGFLIGLFKQLKMHAQGFLFSEFFWISVWKTRLAFDMAFKRLAGGWTERRVVYLAADIIYTTIYIYLYIWVSIYIGQLHNSCHKNYGSNNWAPFMLILFPFRHTIPNMLTSHILLELEYYLPLKTSFANWALSKHLQ